MYKRIYKTRCIFLFVIFSAFFIGLLLWKIYQYQYLKSSELSAIAKNQYSYSERTGDLNYLLFDKNGQKLLNYITKYYAVIDPFIFNKYNIYGSDEKIFTLEYTLKNYDEKYTLPGAGKMTLNQKIYYEIDENTYNKLKDIKGIKGFYIYNFLQVDRSEAWNLENMITRTKNQEDNKLKTDDCIEMNIYNKTKIMNILK